MSVESEVIFQEEIVEMYEEIKQILIGRPDLLQVFNNLVKKCDLNYESESTASSEEYSDSEVVDEKIILKKDGEGFMSLD
jgi:hypothetical protein